MELRPPPASPPLKNSRLASASTSPYATAPSSPRGRLVPAAEDAAAGGQFLTAPPSPNPFDLLPPPATPRLTGAANPFHFFQHFTSAPASPRRAAAIYAHFAGDDDDDGDEDDDEEEFQPRGSYAATGGGSSVPFGWEERPGTPKRGIGAEAAWDTEFEFGTVAGKAVPAAETLTTADELFEKGKIRPLFKPQLKTAADEPKFRPLKPPPGLLDGGSVTSSPRSPAMGPRGVGMWSPRRRSRIGSGGVDFDPFAAALLQATKAAPSPLGGKETNGAAAGGAPGSPAKKAATRPAWRSAGWRRWRLSDLLLFRSSSDGGHANHKQEQIFKTGEQFDAPPVKKAIAQPAMVIKANGGKGDDTGKAKKKQHASRSAAAAAESVAGCARLSPLQRLAKGLGAYTWHTGGRGMAAPVSKGCE